jgi:hypothetical protein
MLHIIIWFLKLKKCNYCFVKFLIICVVLELSPIYCGKNNFSRVFIDLLPFPISLLVYFSRYITCYMGDFLRWVMIQSSKVQRYDARNFCLASLKSLYILCFILRFKFTSGVDCVVLFCNLVDCFICHLSDWPIIHFYAAYLIGPNVWLYDQSVSAKI